MKNSSNNDDPRLGRVSRGRIEITDEIRRLYEERDKSQDNADPDNPVMPPEFWANATIGKFYRPKKAAVNARIDVDVLAWLKSKGEGHLTRLNDILRAAMMEDLKAKAPRRG